MCRAYSVPAPGEPGSESWPQGEQWKTGGGSIWVTANYDPETHLAFWGTGNGGPWMGDQRPGDNLYTSSTVALDATTGKIKGHFQYTPNESFDWDEGRELVLDSYASFSPELADLAWLAETALDPARHGGTGTWHPLCRECRGALAAARVHAWRRYRTVGPR